MKNAWFRRLILSSASLVAGMLCLQAQGQSDQRWYQIEVTLFAYDNAMQVQEHWPMEVLEQALPRNIRPLDRIIDVLSLPEWQTTPVDIPARQTPTDHASMPASGLSTEPLEIAVPMRNSDFRLPDPERDAFLELPRSAHGFTDTNRALASSASYRVLFHNAWRQPLTGANQAVPIWVSGGQAFGDRHELEGSLTVRFNPGQDRVVLDARLWLTQFSSMPPPAGEEIRLPDLPRALTSRMAEPVPDGVESAVTGNTGSAQTWHPVQVIPVVNSREMRSNEFHYIDHPAVGIVVHVFPYTVPPLSIDPAAIL